jgi:hypothetical protein
MVAMRSMLLAAVTLFFPAVAAAQYSGGAQFNEGPFGTGNNGWCRAPPGQSCTTGRQTRQGGSPNIAPTLPGIGSGGASSAPSAMAIIVPPLMLGLRQLFEGGAQGIPLNPPAGPSIPPGATAQLPGSGGQYNPATNAQQVPRLVAGRYDVYNRGTGGATLTPLGWSAISSIRGSSNYRVETPAVIMNLRPDRLETVNGQVMRVFNVYQYQQRPQNPTSASNAAPAWIRVCTRIKPLLQLGLGDEPS